ncbi:3690_t:CDS:1, partial [Acaulospora morrowiae]
CVWRVMGESRWMYEMEKISGPFASPIVRLAGDECVSQLADITPIALMQTSSDESATKKSRNNRQVY